MTAGLRGINVAAVETAADRPALWGREPDEALIRALLRCHAPDFAESTIRRSPAQGSSNWVFRVGQDHAIRLPRSENYADDLRKESRWLPHLEPHLTTPVPAPVVSNEPSSDAPWPWGWSLVTWVHGAPVGDLDAAHQHRLALTLGRFIRELHEIPTLGRPAGPQRWGYRAGEPVTETSDAWVAEAATALADLFDPGQVREAWRRLREVPPPAQEPCWIHTDLSVENLLVTPTGDLAGVVDFGGLGIGDASVDLLYTWSMLDAPAREVLRREAAADDATWLRARAWAFAGPGLVTLQGYRSSMPDRARRLTRMVEAVASEVGIELGREAPEPSGQGVTERDS